MTTTALDLPVSETPSKRARRAAVAPRRAAIGWPEALRTIQALETRERILDRVRSLGCMPEAWGSRQSLEILSDSITRGEDWLELQRSTPKREAERVTLRTLRRQLEVQAWP